MATTAQQSSQALKEFKTVLDGLNIPFCLFLGTALGAYRDGTYCPGDENDMDLAIDIKYFDKLRDIKKAVSDQAIFTHNHDFINKDGIAPEISFVKRHSNEVGHYSKVDLFFISELDGKKCWRFYLNDNSEDTITKFFNKKHFETFSKITFFGVEYNIPAHIEEYLTANYGDWKTPIHRDNWLWHRDNQCEEIR